MELDEAMAARIGGSEAARALKVMDPFRMKRGSAVALLIDELVMGITATCVGGGGRRTS